MVDGDGEGYGEAVRGDGGPMVGVLEGEGDGKGDSVGKEEGFLGVLDGEGDGKGDSVGKEEGLPAIVAQGASLLRPIEMRI